MPNKEECNHIVLLLRIEHQKLLKWKVPESFTQYYKWISVLKSSLVHATNDANDMQTINDVLITELRKIK